MGRHMFFCFFLNNVGKIFLTFLLENGNCGSSRLEECEADVSVLRVAGRSLVSSDARCSRRDLRRDEMPSEIQYVGVLIKSVFSDCELLKHVYLKLSCLIGCVCVSVCLLYAWVSLFGNVHVHIAVIICVNRSSAGNMLHSTNHWPVYSVCQLRLCSIFLAISMVVCFTTSAI